MYYVYVLQLKDGTHYTGYSMELKSRIRAHIEGKISQTKKFRPVKLVFYAAFENKLKALRFEKYLKTMSGFAFRNKRLI